MSLDILPDSRAKTIRGAVQINGIWWVHLYCINCHVRGGLVPEENITHASWICTRCVDEWGPIAGAYMVPDDVFYQRVQEYQIEKYGRVLSPQEQAAELDLVDSPLSRLARQRRLLTPSGG